MTVWFRCSPCKPPSVLYASHLFYVPDLLQPPTESAPYPSDLEVEEGSLKI